MPRRWTKTDREWQSYKRKMAEDYRKEVTLPVAPWEKKTPPKRGEVSLDDVRRGKNRDVKGRET